MSKGCPDRNPLVRQGTSQPQRLIEALLPENIALHELGPEDWLAFSTDIASKINYYGTADDTIPAGNWQNFFPDKDLILELMASDQTGGITPHLALFITFLKLLSHPQESLNAIPGRHLDFYYRKVLQLEPLDFVPDTVHVIYELAKNAADTLVEGGILLEGGKDSEGKLRQYSTDGDSIVTSSLVHSIQGLYVDASERLRYATHSNSMDGLGTPFEEDTMWSAFGDDGWPLAPLQSALAAKVLSMAEGTRSVKVTWDFDSPGNITGAVTAFVTGPDGWLGPFPVSIGGADEHIWEFTIGADQDAVSALSLEIHEMRLDTDLPVVRFSIEDPDNFSNLRNITVRGVQIDTTVSGVSQIEVRNELGTVVPDKPFMAFGPRPKKNSAMRIDVPEFFDKEILGFDINMAWLNMPANFSSHYSHYNDAITAQKDEEVNNIGYFFGHSIAHVWYFDYVSGSFVATDMGEVDNMRDEWELLLSSPYQSAVSSHKMFSTSQPIVSETANIVNTKGGSIELRLNNSFYHDLYPKVLVAAVSRRGVKSDAVPNEPYTPLLDSLTIDYSATSSVSYSSQNASGDVQVFQLSPLGTHKLSRREKLVPEVLKQQLLIALKNSDARSVENLLFQVAEGSENPELSTFGALENIKWSVLDISDQWQPLDSSSVIADSTNNFLRAGIISFDLPGNAGMRHFRMADNLIWLRAELGKPPAAVSKFVNVHAQAATATFADNDNSHEHLSGGLPGETIKQLAFRKSAIKSIAQPYPSFGGKPSESEEAFYQRVSERLRHKDRAISIWDFERLTLQEYPGLYKVKCLNHTRFASDTVYELSPGHVCLVVVPKLSDANTEFRLKPRVSQNTRDDIHSFLESRQSLHVELQVLNPIYEEVQFYFKVRFYKGFDYSYYRQQLDIDFIKLLAPWVYSDISAFEFGTSLYSFDVINYIENLDYVDYIEDFKMSHKPVGGNWAAKKEITPSNSMAVLVPADIHLISEASMC